MSLTSTFNDASNGGLLAQAVRMGNLKIVEALLKQGANVNAAGPAPDMAEPDSPPGPAPQKPARTKTPAVKAQDMKTDKTVKPLKTVRFAGKKPKRDIKPL